MTQDEMLILLQQVVDCPNCSACKELAGNAIEMINTKPLKAISPECGAV